MNWTTKLIGQWLEDPKAVERDLKVLYLLEDDEEMMVDPYIQVEVFGESYRLRNKHVVLNHTDEEIQDIVRNKTIPEVLSGILKEPREYQHEILKNIQSHKLTLLSCARQIGTTSTLATYVAHYVATNWDKSIGFVTKDIYSATRKILKAIELCPYHRQSGVTEVEEVIDELNQKDATIIRFDNGCTVRVFDMEKLLVSPDLLIVDGVQFYGTELFWGIWSGLISRNCKVVLTGLPDRDGKFEKVTKSIEDFKKTNPEKVHIATYDWKFYWFEFVNEIKSMVTTEEWLMEYELLTPGTQEWRERMLDTLLR